MIIAAPLSFAAFSANPQSCGTQRQSEPGLEKWLLLNAEYARMWPNITVKKAPPPDSKEWEGKRTNSNTSRQIPARVIEADSPSAAVYAGTDLPLTGPIPRAGPSFVPIRGAFYSVTYSRLSKSDSNIDVPLAQPVGAASITSAR
jgi:hypothetical protein